VTNLIRRRSLSAVAIACAIGCAVSTSATHLPRIELLREVRVAGANVLLSDLLPKDVESSLRMRSEQIALGAAPQPGSARVLESNEIVQRIGGDSDVASEISIPARIVVSRIERPITAQEVLRTIQNSLRQIGIVPPANVHPEDVLFQTQILVRPGDAGLEVLRADFDAAIKHARFLLRASNDPTVLPFFVAVRLPKSSAPALFLSQTAKSRLAAGNGLRAPSMRRAKQEFLVFQGEESTLILRSGALRMIADVVPLERGTIGQQVRVRVSDTGKVFRAQVDGRAHLNATF
jgi:flagellar basal body P-ring formation chaperone FlgA